MKLTDEKILELKNNARREWNYRADQYNQWDELGRDEQDLEFARAILKEAGVEELERDAERYRWLCRQGYGCDPEPFRLLDDFDSDKQSIDAAIDEAMNEK